MTTEFLSLGLSRHEWQEIHRSLLTRFLMETSLRQEQGLEEIPYPVLVEKIEKLLGMSPEFAHQIFHRMETELWELSWYTYTDEWAWFRAKQDVLKELGPLIEKTNQSTLEKLIERRYEEYFEKYIGEIDMKEEVLEQKVKARKLGRSK